MMCCTRLIKEAARAPREEVSDDAQKKKPLGCVHPPDGLPRTLFVRAFILCYFPLAGIYRGYRAATVSWAKV